MSLFKSGNPALKPSTFSKLAYTAQEGELMTLDGTVNKIAIMLALLVGMAVFSWYMLAQNMGLFGIFVIGGAIGGLVIAIVLAFNKTLAPQLAPVYAVLEGLVLGGVSAFYEAAFSGIVVSAILLTLSIFISLLAMYKMQVIKVTQNFRTIVASATAGIALFYLVTFVLGMFNIHIAGALFGNGVWGIGFSLVVVAIAAANLVMDFDFIEQGVAQRVPKYMEWYAAFGLMVTLVWLYLEILRLLSKLRSR